MNARPALAVPGACAPLASPPPLSSAKLPTRILAMRRAMSRCRCARGSGSWGGGGLGVRVRGWVRGLVGCSTLSTRTLTPRTPRPWQDRAGDAEIPEADEPVQAPVVVGCLGVRVRGGWLFHS